MSEKRVLPTAATLQRLVVDIAIKEKWFIALLIAGFGLAGIAPGFGLRFSMLLGFVLAAYPVVANDSIQTIGTFIASNRDVAWWKKWLFIGGIFVVTIVASWVLYDGDVSYGRLATKGFEEAPQSFHYLQLAAPLFLLMLTRLRIPVSTSLLILTAFATQASAIQKVVLKSLNGYGLAFVASIVLWFVVTPLLEKAFKKPAKKYWRWIQWVTTGVLWSFWWQQDAANIAVYLPRELPVYMLVIFVAVIFVGLGYMIKAGGERIQKIVDEKSYVVDVRSATVIDALYAGLLYYFKILNSVPMSTTWVFLGLLAGREIAIAIRSKTKETTSFKEALRVTVVDGGAALLGLLVSIGLGIGVGGILL